MSLFNKTPGLNRVRPETKEHRKQAKDALHAVIRHLGSPLKTALAFNVSLSAVYHWRRCGYLGYRAAGRLAIMDLPFAREEVRPDIDWERADDEAAARQRRTDKRAAKKERDAAQLKLQ